MVFSAAVAHVMVLMGNTWVSQNKKKGASKKEGKQNRKRRGAKIRDFCLLNSRLEGSHTAHVYSTAESRIFYSILFDHVS